MHYSKIAQSKINMGLLLSLHMHVCGCTNDTCTPTLTHLPIHTHTHTVHKVFVSALIAKYVNGMVIIQLFLDELVSSHSIWENKKDTVSTS